MKSKVYSLICSIIMIVAVMAIVFGSYSASAKSAGTIDEITWALPGFPEVLFCPHAWNTNTGAIMSLVQEGLLTFDDNLAIAPGVAGDWKQVDDVTYVYHLREGVTFHDGTPLTTEDVVYSMSFHQSPNSGSQMASFYAAVDSIKTTGKREITIKLKNPDIQFQYTAAHMAGFLMKKEQFVAHPEDYGTPGVLPIGTGPYKVVEFRPDDRVVLEAHAGYWGGRPPIKRITILAIPDHQTRLLAMRNGDIDGTFDVSISEIKQWKALNNVDVITTSSLGVYILTLDRKTPPLDNVHVRRAIAHSLDRVGLVKALLKGNGSPAIFINPPEMWAGVLPMQEVEKFYATLNAYEFDLKKAKEEWEASGAKGFELSVPVFAADPYMVPIMLSLAENLKQLGITLKIKEGDNTQWLDAYFSHKDLGIQFMSYFPDYADPANYPFLFFSSKNAVENGLNASNYINPKMDALIAESIEKSDPKVRADILKQIARIANEDIVVIPIFWPDTAMAIRGDLKLDVFNAFWYNTPWAIRGLGAKQ